MIDAIGRGLLLPTVLPAIMASLPDSDTASATGLYSFLRSFGFVWGITIPGIILTHNSIVTRHASAILLFVKKWEVDGRINLSLVLTSTPSSPLYNKKLFPFTVKLSKLSGLVQLHLELRDSLQ